MLGVILSPDLDVDSGSIGNFVIRKRLGVFAEKIWRGFWRGYSKSFKHRGFASHFPVFSTFVRLSYIYFWVILIPHVIVKLLLDPAWSLPYVLYWYAIIFLSPMMLYGLCSSDLIHWALDSFSEIKWLPKRSVQRAKIGKTILNFIVLNLSQTDSTTPVNPAPRRLPKGL